ncbi:MAG: Eco47II family restriction endonuclease [Firmicutes bacterium]|nr:Eco47II family restriction endonuclease [Bacillota bacterium]
MAYLDFISNENLEKHIRETILKYGDSLKGINLATFNKNIIDPIKLTFDSIVFNKDIEQIIVAELIRQRDKTNSNTIGYFNQNIFKYIEGCEVPTHGFDVIFHGKKTVYVEIKNKHNTMNSSSSQKTFMRMLNQVSKDQNCECYLVEIIAKKSQHVVWKMSLDGEQTSNERIYRVSVDKFYEFITGDKGAFAKLCEVLPQVITKIVKTDFASKIEQDTVYSELKEHSKDLLRALYLLAFKTYEGF